MKLWDENEPTHQGTTDRHNESDPSPAVAVIFCFSVIIVHSLHQWYQCYYEHTTVVDDNNIGKSMLSG